MTTEITFPIQMYDPKREYQEYKSEIDGSMSEVMDHGRFINGPEVKSLEQELTKFVGAECVSTSNGTDALKIALLALGVGQGDQDEVITVAHSWISTAEVISLVGARPVFIDIDPKTFCLDPVKLTSAITSHTKAIIVVNLYGYIPDYALINQLAQGIPIIEDGAQTSGSILNGVRSCDFTTIGTTSFFPSKPLGCYGDGGAMFTKDPKLALKLRAIKNHGGTKRFHHTYVGLNARLDTIQAAILLTKMKWFPQTLDKRDTVARRYLETLGNLESEGKITLPHLPTNMRSTWAQFSILAKNREERDDIVTHLKENGVNAAIFYPAPLHLQQCFAYLGGQRGDLPITEDICDRIFNLPCYGELLEEEQKYIIKVVKNYYTRECA